jgi:hypothetical protein
MSIARAAPHHCVHGDPSHLQAEAGETTSETVSQKIFDEPPAPGGKGRINNEESRRESRMNTN